MEEKTIRNFHPLDERPRPLATEEHQKKVSDDRDKATLPKGTKDVARAEPRPARKGTSFTSVLMRDHLRTSNDINNGKPQVLPRTPLRGLRGRKTV